MRYESVCGVVVVVHSGIYLDYKLLRVTLANIGAALMVAATVQLVFFNGTAMETAYLSAGGFYLISFAVIRRNKT